jgi:hypothetical protein
MENKPIKGKIVIAELVIITIVIISFNILVSFY